MRGHKRRGRLRGATLVEYVFVLAFVGVVFSLALIALGPIIVKEYQIARNAIASPYP